MKINEIMSKKFESVAPNTSVKEAGILMHDKHIGFVPVLDNGQPVGILTDRDICICGVAVGRDAVMTKVKDIMIKGVATCKDDDDIEEAARVMREHHIRRLVVVNSDDSVAGVVTVDDLARGSTELAGAVLEAATPVH